MQKHIEQESAAQELYPEIGEPLKHDAESYVRWYRHLGQNRDLTEIGDDLFEYGTQVIRDVYSGTAKSPYLAGKPNQPLLLDAANMLTEAVGNEANQSENAYQGAAVLLDSIIQDEVYEPSVRLDAALYRGDLEFTKLHARGEFDEIEWERAHYHAVNTLLSAVNMLSATDSIEDGHKLPVGKMFEAFNLMAARHNLLINQTEDTNMFNTHYRSAYLREDRGHTNNHGERKSRNFDMAKVQRSSSEEDWRVTDKWQFGVEVDKSGHYEADIHEVSYDPEEGMGRFVDNIIGYLKAFSAEARYIHLLNETTENKINPHLKPTNKDASTVGEGINRANEILAA